MVGENYYFRSNTRANIHIFHCFPISILSISSLFLYILSILNTISVVSYSLSCFAFGLFRIRDKTKMATFSPKIESEKGENAEKKYGKKRRKRKRLLLINDSDR